MTSKPAWSNASGRSSTPAFFASGGAGRPQPDDATDNQAPVSRGLHAAGAELATATVSAMIQISQILNDIEQGDPHAASQLLPLVYDELRRLAAQKLAGEKPGQTLQPTALVHEAYLRLVGTSAGPHFNADYRGTPNLPK